MEANGSAMEKLSSVSAPPNAEEHRSGKASLSHAKAHSLVGATLAFARPPSTATAQLTTAQLTSAQNLKSNHMKRRK